MPLIAAYCTVVYFVRTYLAICSVPRTFDVIPRGRQVEGVFQIVIVGKEFEGGGHDADAVDESFLPQWSMVLRGRGINSNSLITGSTSDAAIRTTQNKTEIEVSSEAFASSA